MSATTPIPFATWRHNLSRDVREGTIDMCENRFCERANPSCQYYTDEAPGRCALFELYEQQRARDTAALRRWGE